ncbi:acetyl-CoA/propionyl-CoA carboxylase, biotin carboxylase, biotin carboxyl carrier protein [Albimonas donghaensis]|uniref:Acetyl-CoA/propionyl-CoA carboxylase, biotin carboxylase, biotin carboxyl carrier protein n=1 Tax=Albimonas donghaensis TaxID=356660 RepID=A0A1H3DVJ9_9RHOB|nr:biotin carboxylase N-terminal domain-containing protein [Albimonas donghaensis]SDX69639.1 acetyl-CoA/propionyl-CoA carboxylase, biotin carboxylase, biotin carboxyl carrier protein [Albimonas donghaensis]
MKKVLVANRGEIARRVIRACREAGLATVAIASEADAGSLHARDADECVIVGPAPARASYLRVDAILEAAARSGADAVHPGYGFLSESAEFAAAVQAAGLTWIGPAPATIARMGDKQRAREAAAAAGVPVAPGSPRFAEDAPEDQVRAAAAAVGYPLLIKAASGGGGIGMRRVDRPERLAAVLASARATAGKAFGDATVYLEKFVPDARHVEVQVFGWGAAGAQAFGERDCSLQRRFQKVVEEAPAPGLSDTTRAAMADAAVALCRAVDYEGAGTVEYVYDAATSAFFFLEMNTRIQVEHPVTEMAAGVDLVRMQLDYAAGRSPAPGPQAMLTGHAIECRLYAEDPAKGFLPSPGKLSRFRTLAPGPDLRIETAYAEGDEITPYYDPMIAKIILRGADRDAARRAALATLRAVEIEGVATNLRFLIACLEDPDIIAGRLDTGLLERRRTALVAAAASLDVAIA